MCYSFKLKWNIDESKNSNIYIELDGQLGFLKLARKGWCRISRIDLIRTSLEIREKKDGKNERKKKKERKKERKNERKKEKSYLSSRCSSRRHPMFPESRMRPPRKVQSLHPVEASVESALTCQQVQLQWHISLEQTFLKQKNWEILIDWINTVIINEHNFNARL